MSRPRAATSVAMSRSALAARKRAHHRVALPLLHAAVQRLGAVAVRVERLDERVHLEPRAAEHERRRRALHVEHALQRRRLVRAGRRRRRPGARAAACRPPVFSRAMVMRSGSRRCRSAIAPNPRRHRRREERRLAASRASPRECASRSSAKPMSSISSASSSTSTLERCRASSDRRRRWSSARPGVATTTSAPRSRARICCGIDAPP